MPCRLKSPMFPVGTRIDRLTVIGHGDFSTPKHRETRRYRCRCDCGAEVLRSASDLTHLIHGDAGPEARCLQCRRRVRPIDCARWPIVEANYEWMLRFCARWIRIFPHLEDEIVSGGHEGLVTAARDYIEGRSDFHRFAKYAISFRVRREITHAISHEARRRVLLSQAETMRRRLLAVM